MSKDWTEALLPANNSTLPELDKGTPLNEWSANGAQLQPNIKLKSVVGGGTRGKIFKVEWFQPKQKNYYVSFVPTALNLEEPFRSYSSTTIDPEWPANTPARGSTLDRANNFW